MTTTTIDEFVSQINELPKADRAELLRRLNEPPRKKAETKTNGKKGYVSPDTIWVRDNSHRYRGMYVAIKDGKFIAAARTIKEADQKAKSLGFNEPLLHYIPAEDEEVWGGW
jgi:hypothetical protein